MVKEKVFIVYMRKNSRSHLEGFRAEKECGGLNTASIRGVEQREKRLKERQREWAKEKTKRGQKGKERKEY